MYQLAISGASWSRTASHIWWLAGCQMSQHVPVPCVSLPSRLAWVCLQSGGRIPRERGRGETCKVSRGWSSEPAHCHFCRILCQSKSQGQSWFKGWRIPLLHGAWVKNEWVKSFSHFCNQSNPAPFLHQSSCSCWTIKTRDYRGRAVPPWPDEELLPLSVWAALAEYHRLGGI